MRIGVGGLSCESCTFSPLLSAAGDFRVLSGQDLLQNYDFLANFPEAQFIPLLWARSLPGGSIERGFYDKFKQELLDGLRTSGPWDGLFLHMHGAASVIGLDDAEGDLLTSIRWVVGPDCFIAASYDLHGNVSRKVAENIDLLTAYRTAPHTDWRETLARCCELLVRCLTDDVKPAKAFIPVPILMPGEKTCTDWEPAASLYRSIPSFIRKHNLLDVSVLIGYVWADEPRSTASVLAFAKDPVNAQHAAKQLARRFWEIRGDFQFEMDAGPVDVCIRRAVEKTAKPVLISDSGDNPTAGGAGDVPYVLRRLLALEVSDALVAGIADAAAVELCENSGIGARVELDIGGKLDPVNGKPLHVSGEVVSSHPNPWPRGEVSNSAAVLRIDGVCVVLTERRTPFHRLDDFLSVGIDPREFQIVVIKIGYLVPGLKQFAAGSLLALSPGAVNQDTNGLAYRRLQRPLYPFDPNMEWEPPERSLV